MKQQQQNLSNLYFLNLGVSLCIVYWGGGRQDSNCNWLKFSFFGVCITGHLGSHCGGLSRLFFTTTSPPEDAQFDTAELDEIRSVSILITKKK